MKARREELAMRNTGKHRSRTHPPMSSEQRKQSTRHLTRNKTKQAGSRSPKRKPPTPPRGSPPVTLGQNRNRACAPTTRTGRSLRPHSHTPQSPFHGRAAPDWTRKAPGLGEIAPFPGDNFLQIDNKMFNFIISTSCLAE